LRGSVSMELVSIPLGVSAVNAPLIINSTHQAGFVKTKELLIAGPKSPTIAARKQ